MKFHRRQKHWVLILTVMQVKNNRHNPLPCHVEMEDPVDLKYSDELISQPGRYRGSHGQSDGSACHEDNKNCF